MPGGSLGESVWGFSGPLSCKGLAQTPRFLEYGTLSAATPLSARPPFWLQLEFRAVQATQVITKLFTTH